MGIDHPWPARGINEERAVERHEIWRRHCGGRIEHLERACGGIRHGCDGSADVSRFPGFRRALKGALLVMERHKQIEATLVFVDLRRPAALRGEGVFRNQEHHLRSLPVEEILRFVNHRSHALDAGHAGNVRGVEEIRLRRLVRHDEGVVQRHVRQPQSRR